MRRIARYLIKCDVISVDPTSIVDCVPPRTTDRIRCGIAAERRKYPLVVRKHLRWNIDTINPLLVCADNFAVIVNSPRVCPVIAICHCQTRIVECRKCSVDMRKSVPAIARAPKSRIKTYYFSTLPRAVSGVRDGARKRGNCARIVERAHSEVITFAASSDNDLSILNVGINLFEGH